MKHATRIMSSPACGRKLAISTGMQRLLNLQKASYNHNANAEREASKEVV
jgi:hypothetical protein